MSEDSDSDAEDSTSTLVPHAVQHIRQSGFPFQRGFKENLDAGERPNKGGKKKKRFPNPKHIKSSFLAEPVTDRLNFKATETFDGPKLLKDSGPNQQLGLHTLGISVHTPSGWELEYKETEGRVIILENNKSILSQAFNPSKFDFNLFDLEKGGSSVSFHLYN